MEISKLQSNILPQLKFQFIGMGKELYKLLDNDAAVKLTNNDAFQVINIGKEIQVGGIGPATIFCLIGKNTESNTESILLGQCLLKVDEAKDSIRRFIKDCGKNVRAFVLGGMTKYMPDKPFEGGIKELRKAKIEPVVFWGQPDNAQSSIFLNAKTQPYMVHVFNGFNDSFKNYGLKSIPDLKKIYYFVNAGNAEVIINERPVKSKIINQNTHLLPKQ